MLEYAVNFFNVILVLFWLQIVFVSHWPTFILQGYDPRVWLYTTSVTLGVTHIDLMLRTCHPGTISHLIIGSNLASRDYHTLHGPYWCRWVVEHHSFIHSGTISEPRGNCLLNQETSPCSPPVGHPLSPAFRYAWSTIHLTLNDPALNTTHFFCLGYYRIL